MLHSKKKHEEGRRKQAVLVFGRNSLSLVNNKRRSCVWDFTQRRLTKPEGLRQEGDKQTNKQATGSRKKQGRSYSYEA